MRLLGSVITVITVVSLASACTSGSSGPSDDTPPAASDGSTTATPAFDGPSCADIWVDGNTLPGDYTACEVDGVEGNQDSTECQDGSTLIVFDDSVWAITGGKVVTPDVSPVQDTEDYGAAYAKCTGE